MKKFLLIVTIASLCHALEPKNNCMMPSIPTYQQHVAPVTNSPVQLQTAPPVGGSHNVGHSDPTKAVMNFGF